MNDFELAADLREERGKGAIRRLRRAGSIPAVLYGGNRKPVALKLDGVLIAKRLANEAIYSRVLTIKVQDKEQDVVIKDLQRDPATDRVIHIDFQRILTEQEIRMPIPLNFLNEDSCPGVREAGGVLLRNMVDVEVVCLPKYLPEAIDVNLAELQLGDSIQLSDLTLPENVQLVALTHETPLDGPVVSVTHPQKEEVEEVEGEGEGEELAVAPGEAPVEDSGDAE